MFTMKVVNVIYLAVQSKRSSKETSDYGEDERQQDQLWEKCEGSGKASPSKDPAARQKGSASASAQSHTPTKDPIVSKRKGDDWKTTKEERRSSEESSVATIEASEAEEEEDETPPMSIKTIHWHYAVVFPKFKVSVEGSRMDWNLVNVGINRAPTAFGEGMRRYKVLAQLGEWVTAVSDTDKAAREVYIKRSKEEDVKRIPLLVPALGTAGVEKSIREAIGIPLVLYGYTDLSESKNKTKEALALLGCTKRNKNVAPTEIAIVPACYLEPIKRNAKALWKDRANGHQWESETAKKLTEGLDPVTVEKGARITIKNESAARSRTFTVRKQWSCP